MKIKFQKGYVLVISVTIVRFCGYMEGMDRKTNTAKGAALFPFIFVKSEEFVVPWLITHERIHFRQQIETLFIGAYLIGIIERVYAKYILKKDSFQAYLWGSGEQESYLNQNNAEYLKSRKIWSQFKYIKNKKNITLPKAGEVVVE